MCLKNLSFSKKRLFSKIVPKICSFSKKTNKIVSFKWIKIVRFFRLFLKTIFALNYPFRSFIVRFVFSEFYLFSQKICELSKFLFVSKNDANQCFNLKNWFFSIVISMQKWDLRISYCMKTYTVITRKMWNKKILECTWRCYKKINSGVTYWITY